MSSENLENAPSGEFRDDSYVSRQGSKNEPLPVQADGDNIEDPIDADKADTDEQLVRDDNEAIDESNMIDDRTRHATKPSGTYREPGDEEGIPADDGTSSTDQQ